MSKIIVESQLVDLTDDALIAYIGATWEIIKQLEERMKNDVEIEELQARLKELKGIKYLDEQKRYKGRLRAARALAKAKGLQVTIPDDHQ